MPDTDTDKIRERLLDMQHTAQTNPDEAPHELLKASDTLEKVLDECEQLQNSDNAGLVKSVLANKVIDIIQNELCEEVDDE